jgi:hypothetical protein
MVGKERKGRRAIDGLRITGGLALFKDYDQEHWALDLGRDLY